MSTSASLIGTWPRNFAGTTWRQRSPAETKSRKVSGAIPALAGTFLAGTLLVLPFALLALDWDGEAPPLGLGAIRHASAVAWGGLAFLTLVVTVFALGFQNLAMTRLDASDLRLALTSYSDTADLTQLVP